MKPPNILHHTRRAGRVTLIVCPGGRVRWNGTLYFGGAQLAVPEEDAPGLLATGAVRRIA